jgi:hypothetical protein
MIRLQELIVNAGAVIVLIGGLVVVRHAFESDESQSGSSDIVDVASDACESSGTTETPTP